MKKCFAWQSELYWKTLRWVFKFRKYNTVYNSGLKIWLVSGKSEMAKLFNLKFWLYLWWLGVAFSPHFQAAKRCIQYIFRTYAESFSPIFSDFFLLKILRDNWNLYRTLSINFVLKIRFRKIRCEIKNWNQTLRENLLCVTIRTLRWVLFLSSENIILYTTAV